MASGSFSVQIGASATSVAATKSLRPSFQGQLILPGDPDYESMRKVVYQNMRTDKLPALIARCAGQTDVVPPGSRCIANAYTSNHDRLANEEMGIGEWVIAHAVDTVGVVHAIILRIQMLLLPVQTLVFSAH